MTKTIAYDADYYERGQELGLSGYTDYHWIPNLTIPMVESMIEHLPIGSSDRILDYGCAKGFAVKAFRGLGYDAYGYDPSEYAISQAPYDVGRFCATRMWGGTFDWVICKDVLEHVAPSRLVQTLKGLNASRMFVAIPLGANGKYVVPDYDKDVTHVIAQPLGWWTTLFTFSGWKVITADYTFPGVKEHWTSAYPEGNGFFRLERR